jgi:hypothetical protein
MAELNSCEALWMAEDWVALVEKAAAQATDPNGRVP